MSAKIIDGRQIAEDIQAEIAKEIDSVQIKPKLVVISVGDDFASRVYIKQKEAACKKVGIEFEKHNLPNDTKEDEIILLIKKLNKDKDVHGIIVQLPLPKHIDANKIIDTIAPEKDVDGFHAVNIGSIQIGNENLVPCTPLGIMIMLEKEGIEVEGKNVVIVNNSNIVGKPLAMLLINRFATVTVCHIKTKNLKEHTEKADILITATGVPNLIKEDMVKTGAVVIDAGIARDGSKIRGDVDFEKVKNKASYITPVPGGVGPMTVAMILKNTVKACRSL